MSRTNPAPASGSSPPPAKLTTTDDIIKMGHQWDYLVIQIIPSLSAEGVTEKLKELGIDRWELVTVDRGMYSFKRKLSN